MNNVLDGESGKSKYDGFQDLRGWQLRYATTSDELNTLLTAWHYWRNDGILPNAGGFLDQNKLIMEDFRTLDRVYQYHQKRRKQAKAQNAPKD